MKYIIQDAHNRYISNPRFHKLATYNFGAYYSPQNSLNSDVTKFRLSTARLFVLRANANPLMMAGEIPFKIHEI